ncbi:Gfo/Idh/MocA family protein [Arthrobacter sp. PAMC25284]|uniref:Gfo/Idh/MocA family protein n=1 Tax=Arthrobacter sp. PAMC25284 TaxID=2861279 RepID=UPI001C632778|nr:Gfo/Idh/MocA family oxidoreductase [Arthrobacter sp. PAMC25284]QYF91171.1 Gfo/Idh/MocA family oxidoreductase [Arthrobacter sp. PAMC25284]
MTDDRALPASRVSDSRDAPALRWGIMGPGWIADRFTESVQAHSTQVIAAVGSRSMERSVAFADRHGIAEAFGSYEELAAADVDVIYVATPHNFHCQGALLALDAGKHVLIEKPIGINRGQAELIARRAAEAGLFAAEAMWTFFLPKFDVIRQVLEAGMLGEITTVLAEYGEHFDPEHRIFDPGLAGGPLLDLGTYPLSLITSILGAPQRVLALGQPHDSGVNGQLSAVMSFAGGRQAMMNTQLHNFTPTSATIVGTEATLTIDGPFNMPGGFTVRYPDGDRLLYEEPAGAHFEGLHFEAAAVARAIANGDSEATQRPLSESIRTIAVADAIRNQLGIVFPGEGKTPAAPTGTSQPADSRRTS